MYVRGPEGEDISGLVSRVRLELDPSYAPHTTVELTQQPFHLTRRGWGEFRVGAIAIVKQVRKLNWIAEHELSLL